MLAKEKKQTNAEKYRENIEQNRRRKKITTEKKAL